MAEYDLTRGAAREDLCRFLAACYYQPGQEFAEEKVFEAMRQAASGVDASLAEHARRLGEHFSAAGPDDLLVDYTRLFLGPGDAFARPYGSVWLNPDGGLMQDSTLSAVALYEEGGFDLAEDFDELPDHVAAELEFLYLLINRQNQAHRAGDTEAAESADRLRKQFLAEHLGRWIRPFAAAVRAGAKEPFYRELAQMTEQFVGQEIARAQ